MDREYETDHCYECRGNGDDYMLDGENNWVKACDDCYCNDNLAEDDEDA